MSIKVKNNSEEDGDESLGSDRCFICPPVDMEQQQLTGLLPSCASADVEEEQLMRTHDMSPCHI